MHPFKPTLILRDFHSDSSLLSSLFTPQLTYPPFFITNLLDPHRAILKFTDSPTNNSIRVFYYQLFKICFELNRNELLEQRDYLNELKAVILDDRFRIKCSQKETIDTQRLNNLMFKPLIKEFFEMMREDPHLRFQAVLSQYPILDSIFLNIFKTFLSDFKVLKNFDAQMPSSTVVEELANIFDLGITRMGKCYRFDEADVFCYFENDKELYVATKGRKDKEVIASRNVNEDTAESLIARLVDENKENISMFENITPIKTVKQNLQMSGEVIEEEPSSIYSQSCQYQSSIKKQSIEEFTNTNNEISQSIQPQNCQPLIQTSKSAQQSLFSMLQPQHYFPEADYSDFTSTLVLQIIQQPHRQNIRAVKDRAKQRKGVGSGMI